MLRFAPSPTGDMHIDNLRVALYNYVVSQQKKEDFIVRIEDADKEKNVEGKDQEILDLLALFGIQYSQIIYQSQNVRFHSAMALQLLHEKKAFSCFCSDEWLQKKAQEAQEANKAYHYDDACRNLPAELVIDNTAPFCIRIARPDETIDIQDFIQGPMSFEKDDVDSFVIMHQDKTPTHTFASAVDDMLSDISLVIRSEEYLQETPKQEHIRASLGYDKKMKYAHLPLLLDSDGKKLSHQDETSSVKYLLKEGYLPSAIANYLLLLSNKTPQEIFSIQDAIEWLNLENISTSPARFSIDTLQNINKEHLKNLDAKELSRYVGFADEEIGELAKVYLEEVTTTKELKAKIAPIFCEKIIPDAFKEEADLVVKTIKEAPFFQEYHEFKNYILKESGVSEQKLSQTLRLLLTGANSGPDIASIYKYLKNYLGEIIK